MRSANPSGRSSSRRPRSRPGRRPLPSRRPGPRFPSLRFRSPWCRPVRERGRGPAASVGRLRDADRGPEVRPSRHGARSGGAPARVLPGPGRRVRRHVAGRVPVRVRPRRCRNRAVPAGSTRWRTTTSWDAWVPTPPAWWSSTSSCPAASSSTPTATGPAISRSGGSGCIASARGCGRRAELLHHRRFGALVPACHRCARRPVTLDAAATSLGVAIEFHDEDAAPAPRVAWTLLLLGETVGPLAIIGASAALGVLWRPAMALAFAQFALLLLARVPTERGRAPRELARRSPTSSWRDCAAVGTRRRSSSRSAARSRSASHRSRCRTPSRPRR